GAVRLTVYTRSPPINDLFLHTPNRRAWSWCRRISRCDISPNTRNRVIKLPIPHGTEARVTPAPDKQVRAIPARCEEETRRRGTGCRDRSPCISARIVKRAVIHIVAKADATPDQHLR